MTEGRVFLCLTDQWFSRASAFTFLQDIATRFDTLYAYLFEESIHIEPYGLLDFSKVLKSRMVTSNA